MRKNVRVTYTYGSLVVGNNYHFSSSVRTVSVLSACGLVDGFLRPGLMRTYCISSDHTSLNASSAASSNDLLRSNDAGSAAGKQDSISTAINQYGIQIRCGGTRLDDQDAIKAHALDFFRDLLSEASNTPDAEAIDSVLQHIPPLVTLQDNQMLLRPLELSEIRSAVFSLDPDSAPGPDGFTGVFFRHCWDIIATDLLAAAQEFMAGVPPRSACQ